MLRQRIDANILTSLRAFYFSFSLRFAKFTFFSAYSYWSATLLTLYTEEYAPSPNLNYIIQLPNLVIILKSFTDITLINMDNDNQKLKIRAPHHSGTVVIVE